MNEYMRFLILIFCSILVFVSLSSIVSAGCCSNTMIQDFCLLDMSIEECCPDSYSYGQSGFSDSKEDCIKNHFTEECKDNPGCEFGCCFDSSSKRCFSSTAKVACDGHFSSGSCEIDGKPRFRECISGCCCTQAGAFIVGITECRSVFYQGVENFLECNSLCSRKSCINGCQGEKPLFCKDGRVYNDCTGGDGIIGNKNDCGCPYGKTCMADGNCLENWYSEMNIDANNRPDNLSPRTTLTPLAGDIPDPYFDRSLSCIGISCGENSYCEGGRCICYPGAYPKGCTGIFDLSSEGCSYDQNCGKKSSNLFLILLSVILFLAFIVYLFYRRRRRKEESQGEGDSFGGQVKGTSSAIERKYYEDGVWKRY